jgi:hypothetical protein
LQKTETQIFCKNRNTDKAKESLLRSKGCSTAGRTRPVVVGAETGVVGGFEGEPTGCGFEENQIDGLGKTRARQWAVHGMSSGGRVRKRGNQRRCRNGEVRSRVGEEKDS